MHNWPILVQDTALRANQTIHSVIFAAAFPFFVVQERLRGHCHVRRLVEQRTHVVVRVVALLVLDAEEDPGDRDEHDDGEERGEDCDRNVDLALVRSPVD